MISFAFHSPRVLFGAGSLSHLEREIELLGARRALVLSTPQRRAADDIKRRLAGRCARVLPRTVSYDPAVIAPLPPKIAAMSGMNAIAHGCEGLYAENVAPVHALLAEEGIRALAGGLPGEGERCLYGAWLCGLVL